MIAFQVPYSPTVNHYWGSRVITPRGRKPFISTYLTKRGEEYRESVMRVVKERFGVIRPTQALVRVRLIVTMPDRRERDLDNLPKGIFDAISHAGFWQKDAQVDEFTIKRSGRIEGPGWIDVEIERLTEEPAPQAAQKELFQS